MVLPRRRNAVEGPDSEMAQVPFEQGLIEFARCAVENAVPQLTQYGCAQPQVRALSPSLPGAWVNSASTVYIIGGAASVQEIALQANSLVISSALVFDSTFCRSRSVASQASRRSASSGESRGGKASASASSAAISWGETGHAEPSNRASPSDPSRRRRSVASTRSSSSGESLGNSFMISLALTIGIYTSKLALSCPISPHSALRNPHSELRCRGGIREYVDVGRSQLQIHKRRKTRNTF